MLTLLILMFTAQADELNKKYDWETIPTVEICPESNVNVKHVEVALDYWHNEVGFEFKTIKKVTSCKIGKLNTIQITDGKGVDLTKHLALTSVFTYHYSDDVYTKYVDYAIVRIPSSTGYDYLAQEIMIHEIGHAVGFGHSSHGIMHKSMGH